MLGARDGSVMVRFDAFRAVLRVPRIDRCSSMLLIEQPFHGIEPLLPSATAARWSPACDLS